MDSRLYSRASSNFVRHSSILLVEQLSIAKMIINCEIFNINIILHKSLASMLSIIDKIVLPIFSFACRRHRLIQFNYFFFETCKPRLLIRVSIIFVASCASRCSNNLVFSFYVFNTILLQFVASYTRI